MGFIDCWLDWCSVWEVQLIFVYMFFVFSAPSGPLLWYQYFELNGAGFC